MVALIWAAKFVTLGSWKLSEMISFLKPAWVGECPHWESAVFLLFSDMSLPIIL